MIEIGAKFDNGWSFDGVCKKCGENRSRCKCNGQQKILLPDAHDLRVFIEKRKNKRVTVAKEFFILEENAKKLLKDLKKSMGTGGSYKQGVLELQGEVADKLREALRSRGYKVK